MEQKWNRHNKSKLINLCQPTNRIELVGGTWACYKLNMMIQCFNYTKLYISIYYNSRPCLIIVYATKQLSHILLSSVCHLDIVYITIWVPCGKRWRLHVEGKLYIMAIPIFPNYKNTHPVPGNICSSLLQRMMKAVDPRAKLLQALLFLIQEKRKKKKDKALL